MIAASPRRSASAAADETCPRCGSRRSADQRYCLECGLPLPVVTGRLPSLRRRWIRRLGWYPGDWVWVSLVTLVVAAGGAAAAIVVTQRSDRAHPDVVVAPAAGVAVREPAATPAAPVTTAGARLRTAPAAPAAPVEAPANGRLRWPAGTNGWSVVLVSYPKTTGRLQALDTATRAAKAKLDRVGILDSSGFASLQPGYFVVFAGVYGSKSDADGAVATARAAGFAGAYSRQIAR